MRLDRTGQAVDTERSLADGPRMGMPPPPSSIEVTEEGDTLTITRRWLAGDVIVPLAFGAVWIGFLAYWMQQVSAQSPLFMLFATGHVFVGLLLVYASACRLLNRTTVRVGGGQLRITHGPLPLFGRLGSRTFATERLTQLYTRQASDGRSWWWALSYEVVGRVGDDVVDLVDVRTFEEASFLERAIEGHLKIVDDGRQLAMAPIPRPRSIVVVGGDDLEAGPHGYREAERPADGRNALTIRVRWSQSGVLGDLLFGTLLVALVAYAASTGQVTSQILGASMVSLAGIGLLYRALANALGRTTLTLDPARLTIVHGPLPLPFRRGRQIPIEKVQCFLPLPRPTKRQEDRWVGAGVQCEGDGSFELAPTRENDDADYVVRKLQQHLSRLRGEPVHDPS